MAPRTLDRFIEYILHLDVYLAKLVDRLGPYAYAAISATFFAETGLVAAPFLPGESLLLTSGTLAGSDVLDVVVLTPNCAPDLGSGGR